MTGNQKKVIRKLQWIFYPVALLLIVDFILKFRDHSPLAPDTKGDQLAEVIDKIYAVVGVITNQQVIECPCR